jgi:malto-oligosyltrehalose trehalohydrolase
MTGELFGPALLDDGVTFRLWAPAVKRVALLLDAKKMPMIKDHDWFRLHVPGAKAGMHYQFRIDDDLTIPDPGSRFQPNDVHGPSEVIDQNYKWSTSGWKGRPWQDSVFYELHVGTFTPEGTYRAVIGKLDHLVSTGITAIELMPLSDFPGRWNWGYDGVLPFAPDSIYGRPEDLKALIDAAHARGLMVFLDVVYNHFGPEGNYLHRIAPQFFSDEQTPWGGAIDYRQPNVRAFAIENAMYWLRDYRFDGLRLDAVHAIATPGTPHLLNDLSAAVGKLAEQTGRQIHLVLENDDNRATLLQPSEPIPQGSYRAQWNDDYHHAWHVLLTGERQGYYKDYDKPAEQIARSLAEGFVYQGEPSPHRGGQQRGEPSADRPPLAFVNFLQNHDQVGNRAKGERLTVLAEPAALEAALPILLLSPSTPLLYMGEEWGATEPFPFFCDFKGDLADAVRNGRKSEFAEAYADSGNDIPDPLAETTRDLATLDWSALSRPNHAKRLSLTRKLLSTRRTRIVPLLPAITRGGESRLNETTLLVRWSAGEKWLYLLANLSGSARPCPADLPDFSDVIWGDKPLSQLTPWSVVVALGER